MWEIYKVTARRRAHVQFPWISTKTNPFLARGKPRLGFPAAWPGGVGVRNNSSRGSWARHERIRLYPTPGVRADSRMAF